MIRNPQTPRVPLLLTMAVLLVGTARLDACNSRKPAAKPEASALQIGPTTWKVFVPGWVTVAAPSAAYCAAGLAVPSAGVITSVDSVAMFDERDSRLLAEVPFASSVAVATELNKVQSGNWTGFLAQTTSPVAAGIPNVYCFGITVQSGTTYAQLATALQSTWVGSDEADSTGTLKNTQQAVFQLQTITNDTRAYNFRLFHNSESSNVATRLTADKEDTLYFMQPREFRAGYGPATGWRGVLQDQDPATAEVVSLGYVNYAGSTSLLPDVTATGSLTNVEFTVFGTPSSSSAVLYTFTTALPVPLPTYSGLRLTLPAPAAWPSDGVTVHAQDGDYTKLPVADRQQWTYGLQAAAAAAFRPAGSTLYFGGLYDTITQQVCAISKSYGPTRSLLGPESLRPDSSNGDFTGFVLHSDRDRAGSVAIILITPGYSPVPIPTQWGSVLVLQHLLEVYVPMNAQGVGTSIGFPLPPNAIIAVQTFMANLLTLKLTLSDAALVSTR